MLFNSIEFLFFFLFVGTAYFIIPARFRWVLMLLASYTFYMWWNASYVVLILISTAIDYVCGRAMYATEEKRKRRSILLVSLFANLGFLFTFKYWEWFHGEMERLLSFVNVAYQTPELDVLLPVGISFYTFQTLSYTIDIYRGDAKPETHLGRFALYVAFFPQLVAGPIERAQNLLPQFVEEHRADFARIHSGLQLVAWGFFKKIVIADRVGIYVDRIYGAPELHNGTTLLLATYLFAVQIYCDFSGYSDIAIGTAKVFGFDLMKNFERPYFSTSIRDFWRRWHISLSSWLRDYLYISLGGNRLGEWKTYRNLMITMLLGGLWHGAHTNFIIWGGLQGLMLSVSRMTLDKRNAFWEASRAPMWMVNAVRILVCFHLVCFSWIFFRAGSFDDAVAVIQGIGTSLGQMPYIDVLTFANGALGIFVLLMVEVFQEKKGSVREALKSVPIPVVYALWYGIVVALILFGVETEAQFIYFQF